MFSSICTLTCFLQNLHFNIHVIVIHNIQIPLGHSKNNFALNKIYRVKSLRS